MVDEIYTANDANSSSQVLITTSHRRSMETIAWVRQFGASRVFCFQSGHDDAAYSNVNFREVLARGIRWCARMLG
jgi:type 1 glutamine amidotransferase